MHTRELYIKKILDYCEFKLGWNNLDLILTYEELRNKSIKYLTWYYHKILKAND